MPCRKSEQFDLIEVLRPDFINIPDKYDQQRHFTATSDISANRSLRLPPARQPCPCITSLYTSITSARIGSRHPNIPMSVEAAMSAPLLCPRQSARVSCTLMFVFSTVTAQSRRAHAFS